MTGCEADPVATHDDLGGRCPIPPHLASNFSGLSRTVTGLRRGEDITIVALGSSSTAGLGGQTPYPARLQEKLSARFPRSTVRVLNKGIGGNTAAQMVERFPRDVMAHDPDLVIWQSG
ncbi:MAG: SGNH/GDSL hydrolase family protein, partial [Gemmatimonadetes bacterium]|nr:SGNH/GDSL hydrolase family protein [Gemmatimonadota bacterium]